MNWYVFAAFWICILAIPAYGLFEEKLAGGPKLTHEDHSTLARLLVKNNKFNCRQLEHAWVDSVGHALQTNTDYNNALARAWGAEFERRCANEH